MSRKDALLSTEKCVVLSTEMEILLVTQNGEKPVSNLRRCAKPTPVSYPDYPARDVYVRSQ